MRAFLDSIRVDVAVLLVMVAALMAYPGQVVAFFCDLLGVP